MYACVFVQNVLSPACLGNGADMMPLIERTKQPLSLRSGAYCEFSFLVWNADIMFAVNALQKVTSGPLNTVFLPRSFDAPRKIHGSPHFKMPLGLYKLHGCDACM